MYQVRADIEKNRLYVTIGSVTEENEMMTAIQEIELVVQNLRKGFDCITDLREYEILNDEDEKFVYQAQKILVDAGMSRVVRVIKKFGSLGHFQFDKLSKEVGYHAKSVNSIAEAENLLDGNTF
ncbi:MAG: hypothetical protein R6X10_13830 [Desulfobacterales bacterium]